MGALLETMDRVQAYWRSASPYRHTQLLASIGLLIVLNPFLYGAVGQVAADLLLLVTFLSALFTFADRRSHLAVGLALLFLVQTADWYRGANEIGTISVAYTLLSLAFFGYFTALVLADVFRARAVSLDTVSGALAAYLLIGVWWAFAYALLELAIPGSILGLRGDSAGYAEYLGYSFITLTTLGYGNVVPGNAQADALASVEAIVGQFYLTVLVARLVAMSLTERRDRDSA